MNSGPFPLSKVRFPGSIDTIGQYLAFGHEIWASCDTVGCNHTVRLNLAVLARYLGREHRVTAKELQPYFYCPKCRDAGRHDRRIDFSHFSCTAPHSIVPQILQDNQPDSIQAKAG